MNESVLTYTYSILRRCLKMTRRRQKFNEPKMLSSRVELSDYYKFEDKITADRCTVQQALNMFVRGYISGTIVVSGSQMVGVADV